VELLIVVIIISILMALSAGVVLRYIGVQQKNNTETTLRKLQPLLESQWKAVSEQANKEPMNPATYAWIVNNLGPTDERQVRVIYVKLRLRQEFPLNFAEAIDPDPLPPIAEYRATASRGVAGPTESAACLLMALQRSRGGRVVEASDLGPSVAADVNGDGVQEIIDGWGQPVQFVRWPWKSEELNPGGAPQPGLNDPIDREGLLSNQNWGTAGRTAFQNFGGGMALHPVPSGAGGARTYKLVPHIISGGTDKVLGLDLAGGITSANNAQDNISSYDLVTRDATGQ
jgi:hypothetical protein